jgi:hypothetical protein
LITPLYLKDYLSDTGIIDLDECVAFCCLDGSGTILFQRLTHEIVVTTAQFEEEVVND